MATTTNQTDTFLGISTHLTGFTEIELLGTGMLETYFNVAMNKNSVSTVESFLTDAADIMKKYKDDPANLKAAILADLMPDSVYNGLAKNIITMWYTGNWVNDVISPQSYIQGLIWSTASTHPPGAKQPGYGSWNKAPITNE